MSFFSIVTAIVVVFCSFCIIGIYTWDIEIRPRIYGGYFAEEDQFPYQVAIFNFANFLCGGSIYNEKFILTAAHCLFQKTESGMRGRIFEANELSVVVGVTRFSPTVPKGFIYEVKNTIPHKDYFRDKNDVGIIELTIPLEFSKSIQAIELYTDQTIPPQAEVTVSGWGVSEMSGRIEPGYPPTTSLKYNIFIAEIGDKCTEEVGNDIDTKGWMCLLHDRGQSICNGDSGGPAVFDNKLIGISNLIIGKCEEKDPNLYAYVPLYINWIKEFTRT